jgi:5-formyltetrahydrofolate cyclo-ligase
MGSRVKAKPAAQAEDVLLSDPDDLVSLRKRLRVLRGELDAERRAAAERAIHERVVDLPVFRQARRIAGYLASRGEVDPAPILETALSLGKSIYLPVLTGRGRPMRFAPYRPGETLIPNWLGILEPDVPPDRLIQPQQLDLALTPLVGFDVTGQRLGMGGGYYDRSFAFLSGPDRPDRPRLIGLAHELQKVPRLPFRPWDIPLDAVVTEQRLYPEDRNPD